MKTASPALIAHLRQAVTTVATIWTVTRRDAVVMGFTDHTADLVLDGVTFKAATGYTRSAVSAQSDLSVANLEVDGVLESSAITAADVRAGTYDFAAVEVALVNWADLTMGKLILRTGWLGEVTVAADLAFKAELRGLSQKLQARYVEQIGPDCRAEFGDARCAADLSLYTETGSVTAISSSSLIAATVSGARASGAFNGGRLTFTSGPNSGRTFEIRQHDGGSPNFFHFFLPLPYAPVAGNTFSAVMGCAKTVAACQSFSNIANYRGEPYVPGNDRMLAVGGQAGGGTSA